jgi:hypothetical protein
VADNALPGTELRKPILSAVRQHPANARGVRGIDLRQLLEAPHTLRQFRSQQMPLARMHAQDFAASRYLESFCGAAMGFQFPLCFLLFHHNFSSLPVFRLFSFAAFALAFSGRARAGGCGWPRGRSASLGSEEGHQNIGLHARPKFYQSEIGDFL